MNYKLLIILSILILSGCGQKSSVIETGEVKTFNIEAKKWEFSPNTIEVNLGDKVVLNLESMEGIHGFMLSDFGVNERLEPGNKKTVEFIADKKGSFSFRCSIPCGQGHGGMRGLLVVR